MDQEQLAAGDAAIRGHRSEAVEAAALVACRRDEDEASEDVKAQGLREEAAAAAAVVAGARSEDQRPRQPFARHSGPRSGRVHTGATTALAPTARVRQHEQTGQAPSRSLFDGCSDREDVKAKDMREFDVTAKDMREFDHYIKMHLQQQKQQTQQLLTRLQQHPSPSSTEGGGGEVAAAPASQHLDLELRL